MPADAPASTHAPDPAAADALTTALRALLGPLARLALGRGLTHATLDELLKQALVAAADQQVGDLPAHRRVSRITTATGIHRREVTRLVSALREGAAASVPAGRSHASELFTHWRTDPVYCDRRGSPAELPRQGPAPSFDSLAQAITRDVHPRSLLQELLRLGLAAHDAQRDSVRLVRDAFVPQGDAGRMAAVLGRNVGSHLAGAVDNLLLGDRSHLEQAVFADGLSAASVAEFRRLAGEQWQALLDRLVPALEALVARDAAAAETAASPASPAISAANPAANPAAADPAAAPPRHQVRLGLYTYTNAPTPAPSAPPAPLGVAPAPDAPDAPP